MLTSDSLKELLDYDSESGAFTWRVTMTGSVKAGSPAGSVVNGYTCIRINGHRYPAHRLAWLYMTEEWPFLLIDHIDGSKSNNAFSNLRCVTTAENNQNRKKAHKNSKSGYLGVSPISGSQRFKAQITVNKKVIHIGNFSDPKMAHEAYLVAKRQFHSHGTI